MDLSELCYIDETGYHYADYPTVLLWLQGKYRAIYGEDVYLEDDSQDGQFLAILAKAFYDTFVIGASVYSSFSPATAQGAGLSRVVRINGISRRIPTKSTVTVTIVGVADTVITNGVAQDQLGQKWDLPASVTIPIGGEIDVVATAQEDGAVQALPTTVTQIFTPTLGWQTVSNAAASTPGAPVETDAELRVRQAISTAIPSLTVFEGTIGAVASLPGVLQVRGYENDTDVTDADGIPEHSICLVVDGGDDVEICETIALKKTPGCGTYGDTTETVYDARGVPIDISFQRADPEVIKARVTLSAGSGWSTDYIDLIKAAVAETIENFGIGNTILISKLYTPAYLTGTPASQTFDIALIEIAKNADPFATVNVDLAFDEMPVCDVTNVTVVVT